MFAELWDYFMGPAAETTEEDAVPELPWFDPSKIAAGMDECSKVNVNVAVVGGPKCGKTVLLRDVLPCEMPMHTLRADPELARDRPHAVHGDLDAFCQAAHTCPNAIFVHNVSHLWTRPQIGSIVLGRHNILNVFEVFRVSAVPPSIRSNFGYVFVFYDSEEGHRRKVWETFFSHVPRADFERMAFEHTRDHGCLVVDRLEANTRREPYAGVYRYKAELH